MTKLIGNIHNRVLEVCYEIKDIMRKCVAEDMERRFIMNDTLCQNNFNAPTSSSPTREVLCTNTL